MGQPWRPGPHASGGRRRAAEGLALWAAIRMAPLRKLLIWLDDALGYGKRNPLWKWWRKQRPLKDPDYLPIAGIPRSF